MPVKKKSTAPFITIPIENSEIPIYRQIYEALRRQILSSILPAKTQLPSTRALSRQLAVSRMTVVNAYEQLFAEGYIEGVSGSGTYVASVLPEELLEIEDKKRQKAEIADKKVEVSLSRRGERLLSVDYVNLRASRITGELHAFHYGLPALDEFPFDVWSRLVARRLRKVPMALFGSGNSEGYQPLRVAVSDYLQTARAVRCSPEQIIITNGAQQALSLIAQVLIDEGETIWLENPGYPGARDLLIAAGAQILSVPVDREGFDLNFAVRQNNPARIACVTPSHQFPLGTVMSLARRLALIEWARRNDSWIIEDDYDSEFRYSGRPLASLQGLDESGERVIYVGTFSKTIFPALRLGFMVVPKNLIAVFTAARALADSHSPSIDQAVLTDFIEQGHFSRHVRRMRQLYAERQEVLVSAAGEDLAGLLEIAPDEAGMHLIGWLPTGACDKLAAEKAKQHNIETKPLSAFSTGDNASIQRGGLILGYTAFSPGQIRYGVQRLTQALS